MELLYSISKRIFYCFLGLGLLMPLNSLGYSSPGKELINIHTLDCTSSLFAPLRIEELALLDRRQIELRLDRKLSFRERQTLKIIKGKIRKLSKSKSQINAQACMMIERKASNSIAMGIVGLFFAGLIFGGIALSSAGKAKRYIAANPDCPGNSRNRRKARTGTILGIIDIIGALLVIGLLSGGGA